MQNSKAVAFQLTVTANAEAAFWIECGLLMALL